MRCSVGAGDWSVATNGVARKSSSIILRIVETVFPCVFGPHQVTVGDDDVIERQNARSHVCKVSGVGVCGADCAARPTAVFEVKGFLFCLYSVVVAGRVTALDVHVQ